MKALPDILFSRMKVRRELDLWRTLKPASGVDFTSNDYLGFSDDQDLRSRFFKEANHYPLTGSGSRLLRGELELYQSVEKTCAEFSKTETAMLYPSGYQANISLFSALLNSSDHVFSDALNHASIIDGIVLSRAKKTIYPHRDLKALEANLKEFSNTAGLKLIVTESIFSMDGSLAPLLELAKLAKIYDASLIVDEAHATGLVGAGYVQSLNLENDVLATTHTGGKSLGASGAWIACNYELKDYLVQFARGFIYSTAPFPLQSLLLKLSIEHLEQVGPARVKKLQHNLHSFQKLMDLPKSDSPIVPILSGSAKRTLTIAHKIQALGFDVRAIRPPTVPEGTSRLRIIIHAQNNGDEIQNLAKALNALMKDLSTP